jgi:aminoglycoside 3-N-acetyltransferase
VGNSQVKKQIVSDLHKLGVGTGDVILVHSSFKSLGKHELTPGLVISALLAAIGSGGTLLMPALSYKEKGHAEFSVLEAPSEVGILTESFRLRQGTLRSCHPTHSVCGVGSLADNLLKDHKKDKTPCGANSPFRKILEIEAKIIMLGCGLRPNTLMHALEEMICPEYLFGDYCDYHIKLETGNEYTKKYRKHGFAGWNQEYDKIALLACGGLFKRGNVLDADTYVIDTQKFKAIVLSKLKDSPLFFVSRI